MVIRQGDVYWMDLGEPDESEPGYMRPWVVVQNNLFNSSRINTVVVCPLTSNLARASAPGNVTLDEGDANLMKSSIVLVSQITTVNKSELGEYIGTLSGKRIHQIVKGIAIVVEPREIE